MSADTSAGVGADASAGAGPRTGPPARGAGRAPWLAPALVLLGVGWGSNQFAPLLLVYREAHDLGTGTLTAMFGAAVLGLVPGFLIAGPLSDARGRRAVVVPAAVTSLVASLVLIAGTHGVAFLVVGRTLVGLSSGAAFSAGTAWLREASLPPLGTAHRDQASRRAAVAMTTGFALGPLAAGLLAEWAPAPTVVPYLPHVALMAAVCALLRGAPETVRGPRAAVRLAVPGLQAPRFRRVVAPMAPWVFAAPTIAFALLPSVVGASRATNAVALAAAITALTAVAGVSVQPVARRLEARGSRTGVVGLVVLGAGLVLGAVTAHAQDAWLLAPCAVVLGCAYGMCLVAGLAEVQRIARDEEVASLTAAYYALTYVGFASPYLFAVAAHAVGYPTLLALAAALALATAGLVAHRSGEPTEPGAA